MDWQDKERLAIELGLPNVGRDPLLNERIVKTIQQERHCNEAISTLLVERALPFIFNKAVKKAEIFAAQCEHYLNGMDEAAQFGKQAARQRLGIEN
ncbi:MAG: hypothetical protein FJX31_06505 [Alphaproteobacteria bacterium]|nr:hypothetical protein [Alphaproteobacteria bacterium]